MTAQTATLTDFLLARIAEDEEVARAAMVGSIDTDTDGRWEFVEFPYEGSWPQPLGSGGSNINTAEWAIHATRHDPARVLAECEAKRKAIEAAWSDYMAVYNEYGHGLDRDELAALGDAPEVVKALAQPYASHPDFRPEWLA